MAAFFLWIVNVHNHKKCAEQQSRCINLLLLPQCFCTQEGVHLTQVKTARGVQRSKLTEGLFWKPRSPHAPEPWPSLGNGPFVLGPVVACNTAAHPPRVAQTRCMVPSMSIPPRSDSEVPASFATTVKVVTSPRRWATCRPTAPGATAFLTSRTQRRRAS